jgi:hypothetical protein
LLEDFSSDLVKIEPKKLVPREPSRNSLRKSPYCKRLTTIKVLFAVVIADEQAIN